MELNVTERGRWTQPWHGRAVGHLGPGWHHKEFRLRLHELEAVLLALVELGPGCGEGHYLQCVHEEFCLQLRGLGAVPARVHGDLPAAYPWSSVYNSLSLEQFLLAKMQTWLQ